MKQHPSLKDWLAVHTSALPRSKELGSASLATPFFGWPHHIRMKRVISRGLFWSTKSGDAKFDMLLPGRIPRRRRWVVHGWP